MIILIENDNRKDPGDTQNYLFGFFLEFKGSCAWVLFDRSYLIIKE